MAMPSEAEALREMLAGCDEPVELQITRVEQADPSVVVKPTPVGLGRCRRAWAPKMAVIRRWVGMFCYTIRAGLIATAGILKRRRRGCLRRRRAGYR